MTHVWGVLTEHGRVASCIVGVSDASKNQEAKEKPPPHGDPAPRIKHFSPPHADPTPQLKHFPPLHADPTPRMKHFPPPHGDPTPLMKHFPPLHGMDRAVMKFLSPTHTQNAQFPTIFSVLGRYFFHRGTPHNHTVRRRGDLSFMHPPDHPRRGGHQRNRAHLETQSLTAMLVGAAGPGLRKVACNSIGRSFNNV